MADLIEQALALAMADFDAGAATVLARFAAVADRVQDTPVVKLPLRKQPPPTVRNETDAD